MDRDETIRRVRIKLGMDEEANSRRKYWDDLRQTKLSKINSSGALHQPGGSKEKGVSADPSSPSGSSLVTFGSDCQVTRSSHDRQGVRGSVAWKPNATMMHGRKSVPYRLSVKLISRARGQSAVAAAAYRSGESLMDRRAGITKSFGRVERVVFAGIYLPIGAPEWMRDREQLWNAVENCEKRWDSQLAREIQLSLPAELSISRNIALVERFSDHLTGAGMVVDAAIHVPIDLDSLNIHAHLMLTTRELRPEIDVGFGRKVRGWNSKETLVNYRKYWARCVNEALQEAGVDAETSHLSNVDRGESLPAEPKLGHRRWRTIKSMFGLINVDEIVRDDVIERWALIRSHRSKAISQDERKHGSIVAEEVSADGRSTRSTGNLNPRQMHALGVTRRVRGRTYSKHQGREYD